MMIYLAIILVAGLILYTVLMAGALGPAAKRARRQGSNRRSLSRAELQQRWATIHAMSLSGGNGLRQAVSEADKLFDHAMQAQGIRGETMGERLKNARDRFQDRRVYDGVWQAHKLRNALAHEVGFDLVASQAQDALRQFERGLKDLGAL